jgi:Pro-kumamolisin, activation domain
MIIGGVEAPPQPDFAGQTSGRCATALALLCWLLASALSAEAAGVGLKTLPGHVPNAVLGLVAKDDLASTNRLNLAIGLSLKDEPGLDDFLRQLYDPGSPNYRRFITPEQFAERFSPTQRDYDIVAAFARRNGLTVTALHANRLLVDVNGSPEDIRRAFHITLRTYRHPVEDRDFFAPDAEPSVAADLAVKDISGLNDFVRPKPWHAPVSRGSASPKTGSGANGSYFGKDFRAAYLPGVTLTGTGQSVGLVQFDGFYSKDITAYATAEGLSAVPVQTVLLDGFNGKPTTGSNSGSSEVSLDIEMAMAIAPGLSTIVAFEAGPNGLPNDILNAMASRSQIKQLSCSWGWGGGPSVTTDNIFKQMAAQGQTFLVASGDGDAYPANTVDSTAQAYAPVSSPYVTAVGGTTLATSGPGGRWLSELVWNAGGGTGSGGGISSHYAIPAWQAGVSMAVNKGSATHRNLPDVALVADNIAVRDLNGKSEVVIGTSCATPLWAGLMALVNQQAVQAGKPPVGFLNPAIYAIGQDSRYHSCLHDITSGNNISTKSAGNFLAAAGYDLCTGWGTPAGQALIDALAGVPDEMTVAPTAGIITSGAAGGPFLPQHSIIVVSNAGPSALVWSTSNSVPWLASDPAGGTLKAGASQMVTVSLTPAAQDLAVGKFAGSTVISNLTAHTSRLVPFSVNVGQSIVQNGGFETGDFTGWTLVGDGTVPASDPAQPPIVYDAVEGTDGTYQAAHQGNYGAFLGDNRPASLSQVLDTSPEQLYLVSCWLNNPNNGPGQQFSISWNSGAPIYSLSGPPAFAWTNLQFLVTAAGTTSRLQFEAENDTYGFDLDDVAVTPVPLLAFQAASWTGAGIGLNWRAIAGVAYQIQYRNDLTEGDWVNLGVPVVARGNSVSVSDPDGPAVSAGRFYRLVLAP